MTGPCVTLLCLGLFSAVGLSHARGTYNKGSLQKAGKYSKQAVETSNIETESDEVTLPTLKLATSGSSYSSESAESSKSSKPGSDPTGTDKIDWIASGQAELEASLKSCFNVGIAKNVILFLGDGMGMSTVTAARWLQAQRDNASIHDTLLPWDTFPHVALAKTYNVDVKTADSAACGTAYLSGVKARKGTVGVNQDVVQTQCDTMLEHNKVRSILHKSHDAGKWTGVVTTTRATHATPAATFASSPDRKWESDSDIPDNQKACKDIAYQLIKKNDFIRVFLAGGRTNFLPDNETDPERPDEKGRRQDRRNLLKEWLAQKKVSVPEGKFHLVMNDTDFKAVDMNTAEYLMGLFEANHMQFEADREDIKYETWGEPSLTEMTEKAIGILKRAKKGYFLMVEGGRIDHGHHDGNAYRALDDTLEMARAVGRADELTGDDTLIVVTADHSHVFTMGGYPHINHNIFDIANHVNDGLILDEKLADDGLPLTTLAYANGPGYEYHFSSHNQTTKRRNLTEDSLSTKMLQKDYLQPASVPLSSETHGGEDVAIYAKGPMSHLFHGTHEQSYIAHVMMYASCVGDNREPCEDPRPFKGPCQSGSGVNGSRGRSASVGVTVFIVFFVFAS